MYQTKSIRNPGPLVHINEQCISFNQFRGIQLIKKHHHGLITTWSPWCCWHFWRSWCWSLCPYQAMIRVELRNVMSGSCWQNKRSGEKMKSSESDLTGLLAWMTLLLFAAWWGSYVFSVERIWQNLRIYNTDVSLINTLLPHQSLELHLLVWNQIPIVVLASWDPCPAL